ncbi:MAG: hypothetical protein QM757_29090 [Paludibaculum sp.]
MRHFHGPLPACLVLLVSTLAAGQVQDKPKDPDAAESHLHYPFITDAENRIIQDYYRIGSGHLPPGVARKGDVPLPLAKQLHRAGVIPAGLDKKLDKLPDDLDRKLVPVPAGYLRLDLRDDHSADPGKDEPDRRHDRNCQTEPNFLQGEGRAVRISERRPTGCAPRSFCC